MVGMYNYQISEILSVVVGGLAALLSSNTPLSIG